MQQLCESSGFKKVTDIVPGGSCRQASVACGMERVADDTSVVLVHDGARPFVSKACIERVVDAAYKYSAAAPAVRQGHGEICKTGRACFIYSGPKQPGSRADPSGVQGRPLQRGFAPL